MHELAVIGNPRGRDAKGRFLKRSKKAKARRSSSRGKRRSTKARAVGSVKRRRSSSKGTRKSSRRTSIVTVTRYRSNPRGRTGSIVALVTDSLLPSAIAAGGALAVDVGLGYVPLPERFKAGPVRHVTRALASIALGVVSTFVVKPTTAAQILSGGLTVTFHQAAREALARAAPKLKLAELEDDGVSAFEEQVAELLEDERAMGALSYEGGGMAAFESPFASPMAAVDEEIN